MQSFRQWLETRKSGGRPKGNTVKSGVPYVTDPYKWGQPTRPNPDREIEREHNLLKRKLPVKLYWTFRKFIARKAQEQGQYDGNEKRLMARVMQWAKKADPTGGKHIQWILSQILKGNIGISTGYAQQINRVLRKFYALGPQLKAHQDERFNGLQQKMHGMTFDEVEELLDLLII
jgi:hypothetical protein